MWPCYPRRTLQPWIWTWTWIEASTTSSLCHYNFNRPVLLKSHHGTYLRAYSNGKVDLSANNGDWEKWVIVPADIGNKDIVGFRSYWNKFLSARGSIIVGQVNVLDKWEKWTVKRVNGKLAFTSYFKKNLRADKNNKVNQHKNLEDWELWQTIYR
eukprot:TRINITY_DN6216_c0_g1_i3.p1 TRINITY_DN6216_c0_g1~~TRINITY_DN6216_c0_g1_i3.p1  ORF type:complete len:155 (+),score=11.72 TRINITY_DN6216_c0_g1_i3:253-717(+)